VTDALDQARVDTAPADEADRSTDQPPIRPGVLGAPAPARHPLGRHDSRLIYTIDEVAALLRISRSTAYECAQTGELPVLRLGRRVLVTRRTLEQLLGIDTRRTDNQSPRRIHIARAREPRTDPDRPDWARSHRRNSTES
jgi:excisionase family DNA binding protein